MAVTSLASGTWTDLKGSSFTVTIASPGVFTLAGNGFGNGDKVVFQTTGALPTGLTAGTTYYIVNNGTDGSGKFRVATSEGGSDVNTSGSQSGTHSITTVEHILANTSAAATYTLDVDLVNLASGDVVEIRWYKMVVTSGTRRGNYFQSYTDDQPADGEIVTSVPASTPLTDSGALRATIKQTAGTARAFVFNVLKYA